MKNLSIGSSCFCITRGNFVKEGIIQSYISDLLSYEVLINKKPFTLFEKQVFPSKRLAQIELLRIQFEEASQTLAELEKELIREYEK